jgi:hypothetical protein
MLCGLVVGSDKTTVSVGTGNNEYYPVYLSLSNFTNDVRRAHGESVVLIGFLAIPKGEENGDVESLYSPRAQVNEHKITASAFASFVGSCSTWVLSSSSSALTSRSRRRRPPNARMGYGEWSSTRWLPTSLTTPSKSCSQVLFKAGVQGNEITLHFTSTELTIPT